VTEFGVVAFDVVEELWRRDEIWGKN
jgi:hypothetical protein